MTVEPTVDATGPKVVTKFTKAGIRTAVPDGHRPAGCGPRPASWLLPYAVRWSANADAVTLAPAAGVGSPSAPRGALLCGGALGADTLKLTFMGPAGRRVLRRATRGTATIYIDGRRRLSDFGGGTTAAPSVKSPSCSGTSGPGGYTVKLVVNRGRA